MNSNDYDNPNQNVVTEAPDTAGMGNTSSEPELRKCSENLPPELWKKWGSFAASPAGSEALRPFLAILAQEIFNELAGVKVLNMKKNGKK
jgi:hypothetical protein